MFYKLSILTWNMFIFARKVFGSIWKVFNVEMVCVGLCYLQDVFSVFCFFFRFLSAITTTAAFVVSYWMCGFVVVQWGCACVYVSVCLAGLSAIIRVSEGVKRGGSSQLIYRRFSNVISTLKSLFLLTFCGFGSVFVQAVWCKCSFYWEYFVCLNLLNGLVLYAFFLLGYESVLKESPFF